jgi:hypothetical protein
VTAGSRQAPRIDIEFVFARQADSFLQKQARSCESAGKSEKTPVPKAALPALRRPRVQPLENGAVFSFRCW